MRRDTLGELIWFGILLASYPPESIGLECHVSLPFFFHLALFAYSSPPRVCIQQAWMPIHPDWRLNEQMYGALEGLNKRATAERYGAELTQQWRRSCESEFPFVVALDVACRTNPSFSSRRSQASTYSP